MFSFFPERPLGGLQSACHPRSTGRGSRCLALVLPWVTYGEWMIHLHTRLMHAGRGVFTLRLPRRHSQAVLLMGMSARSNSWGFARPALPNFAGDSLFRSVLQGQTWQRDVQVILRVLVYPFWGSLAEIRTPFLLFWLGKPSKVWSTHKHLTCVYKAWEKRWIFFWFPVWGVVGQKYRRIVLSSETSP